MSASHIRMLVTEADYWGCRLESAILDTLATVPASVKTPDIGGTGGTKSLVRAITERL